MPGPAELSAPETYVLISLPKIDLRKALKLGFMGLLAQGVLRLETEDKAGLFRTRHIPHLKVADGVPETLPPIAASLVKIVRAAEPNGLMKDIVRRSLREYGNALFGFVRDYIGPALAGRGLAERRRIRLLGIIPSYRYERTPAGDEEKIRIETAMQDARTIPQYLDRDPAQVAALVVAAGSAILLVEELRPFSDQLSRAMRGQDGGSYMYIDSNSFSDGGGGFANFDFGGIDFSCFDGGAFDSFNAGFDAGGDGGGGDGGSSGC
jgi:hypothetical protein